MHPAPGKIKDEISESYREDKMGTALLEEKTHFIWITIVLDRVEQWLDPDIAIVKATHREIFS